MPLHTFQQRYGVAPESIIQCMKWIDKLERRFGSWAIPNLSLYLIALQAIGAVMLITDRVGPSQLHLVGRPVIGGEWWRLVSFMMLPQTTSLLFLFFAFCLFFMISHSLEGYWGNFRFNLFILTGYLLTVATAFIHPDIIVTNTYFLGTIFLAFATIFPQVQFRLFLIVPVKVKWLGWLTAIGYLLALTSGPVAGKWGAGSALITYLLFFGNEILSGVKMSHRRKVHAKEHVSAYEIPRHTCAACGATDKNDEHLNFRYCSVCATCFCEEHIGEHSH